MRFIDTKFKNNYKQYILQCSLAFIVTFIIFLFIDLISSLVILASFGASTFIAFTMPWGYAAKPRNLIGGYIVGSIIGVLMYEFLCLMGHSNLSLLISSALCVALTSFIMVITDTEHPPAVGMALGLVINQWSFVSIFITLSAIVLLSISKELVKPRLINLK